MTRWPAGSITPTTMPTPLCCIRSARRVRMSSLDGIFHAAGTSWACAFENMPDSNTRPATSSPALAPDGENETICIPPFRSGCARIPFHDFSAHQVRGDIPESCRTEEHGDHAGGRMRPSHDLHDSEAGGQEP